jgi:hypothetical protein
MSTEARSRAAEVLGLPPDAPAEVATSAFLAGLPAAGFVPPGAAVAALNTLAGTALPADGESNLRAEVEEFAARFWSLEPAGRLAAWHALGNRSPDEAASARLLALQPGLGVTTTPQGDPLAEEVAVLARELFVLPPRQRAIRRNEWLLASAGRHRELTAAAAGLAQTEPALAALEPVLFARLSPQFDAAGFARSATAEPLPAPPGEPRSTEGGFATHPAPPAPASGGSRADASSGRSWPVGWVVVVAVVIVIRAVVALSGGSTSSSPTPTYHYPPPSTAPAFHPQKYPARRDPQFGFTPAEVDGFKRYNPNSQQLPPPLYWNWVMAGRPEASQPVPEWAIRP